MWLVSSTNYMRRVAVDEVGCDILYIESSRFDSGVSTTKSRAKGKSRWRV
jgi:hypothetical protein